MKDVRRGMAIGLVLLIVAAAAPLAIRWATQPSAAGPAIDVELPGGGARRVSLADMKRLPALVRHGEAQNQYGNWRDAGTYQGVLLSDVLHGVEYEALDVVASDGYRVTIERARVEDARFPMVLAYARDGVLVPEWDEGFRIVVLPESGRVGNAEYGTASAGSFWVKNVARIAVGAEATTAPGRGP